MDLTFNIIINIYSIALLIIICYNSLKHDEKESLQHKLYMMVLKNTILMLVVDIFSRFDGKPDTIYPVITVSKFYDFLVNSILPSSGYYMFMSKFFKMRRNQAYGSSSIGN